MFQITHQDGVLRLVQQGGLFVNLGLRLLALCDVTGDADDADDVPLVVAVRGFGHQISACHTSGGEHLLHHLGLAGDHHLAVVLHHRTGVFRAEDRRVVLSSTSSTLRPTNWEAPLLKSR